MAITKDVKETIIAKHAKHDGDTGSPEVQIALLTARIDDPHRAPQDPQEGPSQPARPAQDGRPASPPAQLPAGARPRALPRARQGARAPQVATPHGAQTRRISRHVHPRRRESTRAQWGAGPEETKEEMNTSRSRGRGQDDHPRDRPAGQAGRRRRARALRRHRGPRHRRRRAKTREGQDFFPLTVDVEERHYAAGKIPGGFIKRESRPEREGHPRRAPDRPAASGRCSPRAS